MSAIPAMHRSARKTASACSGCSLCVPVCPVWRSTRDLRLSPEGRARALQHGADLAEVAASVKACTFCGACEPVCPENIDLLGTVRKLRRQLPDSPRRNALRERLKTPGANTSAAATGHTCLIPGAPLRARTELLDAALRLVGGSAAAPLAEDISLALETGVDIPAEALERFLAPLRRVRRVIVADGTLLSHLRAWLPRVRVAPLGEQLSKLPGVRAKLGPDDLYLIDARAYHADYERLVMHYHRLREERGIQLNLDLQRLAVPASAQGMARRLGEALPDDAEHVNWILKGRRVNRIIAERMEDQHAFARHAGIPVLNIVELAGANA